MALACAVCLLTKVLPVNTTGTPKKVGVTSTLLYIKQAIELVIAVNYGLPCAVHVIAAIA